MGEWVDGWMDEWIGERLSESFICKKPWISSLLQNLTSLCVFSGPLRWLGKMSKKKLNTILNKDVCFNDVELLLSLKEKS